ncbi:conserved protein, unknown function [Hepatocystis sp. ex Piliocolobus tephrosceles]|nr:conserved protein, unknown function [Hepatocystis sp. ex Piliocolobus tephrosceles]
MDLINLLKYKDVSLEYKMLLRAKKENIEKEQLAAIVIQKCVRGYFVRKTYILYKNILKDLKDKIDILSCKYILKKLKQKKVEEQELMFKCYNAIKIQKTFRGYYSRKYVHDFYKRKKEIIELDNYVKMQQSEFSKEIEKRKKQQMLYDQELREQKIYNVAKNLHHVVSTKAQKGVYNPKIENIIKKQQEKHKIKKKKVIMPVSK